MEILPYVAPSKENPFEQDVANLLEADRITQETQPKNQNRIEYTWPLKRYNTNRNLLGAAANELDKTASKRFEEFSENEDGEKFVTVSYILTPRHAVRRNRAIEKAKKEAAAAAEQSGEVENVEAPVEQDNTENETPVENADETVAEAVDITPVSRSRKRA